MTSSTSHHSLPESALLSTLVLHSNTPPRSWRVVNVHHAKLGKELNERLESESLNKYVCRLVLITNSKELHQIIIGFLSHNVTINVQVLSMLMEDRVCSNV